MEEKLLAVDVGTQSVRALIFNGRGDLLARSRVPIEPYVAPRPGFAEQDPDLYWRSLIKAIAELRQKSHVDLTTVRAMALTTQRATVVNLDKNGRPLRPAIVWLDQRRTEDLPPVKGLWGNLFKLGRLSDTVAYLQSEAEANWIKHRQPEIWEQTAKYLFLSGYLSYKLTGKYVDAVASQVGYMPFDFKRQQWSRRWDWKWKVVSVKKSMLPKLVPAGKVLGVLSKKAAKECGLPKDLPIIAAGSDKACEVIGSGFMSPSHACLGLGTTATINVVSQQYKEIIPLLPPYPAAIPEMYNLEIQIYRGYWMVSWFKEELGLEEKLLAEEQGVEAETILDQTLANIPPGSDGLILQPYWSPGLRHPGPEARGAIIGFGDVHTRGHIYRAILEGIAYALREGAERIQKRTGNTIRELRVAGGGSRSHSAMQITADIFGLPAIRPHTWEASGLGAAICAAVGSGIHTDFKSAIASMTRKGEVFEPDESTHQTYNNLFRQVYKNLYPKLKPLYRAIYQILG